MNLHHAGKANPVHERRGNFPHPVPAITAHGLALTSALVLCKSGGVCSPRLGISSALSPCWYISLFADVHHHPLHKLAKACAPFCSPDMRHASLNTPQWKAWALESVTKANPTRPWLQGACCGSSPMPFWLITIRGMQDLSVYRFRLTFFFPPDQI